MEIEQAIEKFEFLCHGALECNVFYGVDKKDLWKSALSALRAQQERENPPTCDGCTYRARKGFNYENCVRCKRHWPDRYDHEPKEEPRDEIL